MAVKRAWVNPEGAVKNQLTDEELSSFYQKIINGLNLLANYQVVGELKAENQAAETARKVVDYVW